MHQMNSQGRARLALLCALLLPLEPLFAQSRPALETDARLSTQLTVRVGATPLKTLLKQWSHQAGVELSADASIREYRAFARLTNRPLHEAMRLLAEAFDFEWRVEQRDPDAPPSYVLYAPPGAVQQQNLLRDALAQDQIALLQRAVREIPEELFKLDYESYCRALGSTPVYALYAAAVSREPLVNPQTEPAYAPIIEPSHAPLENPDALLVFAMRRELLLKATQSGENWLTLHLLRTAPLSFWRDFALNRQATLSLASLPETLLRTYEQVKAKYREAIRAYEAMLDSGAGIRVGLPLPAPPADEKGLEEEPMVPEEDAALDIELPEIQPLGNEPVENLCIACYIPEVRLLKLHLCTAGGNSEEMVLNLEQQLWQLYESDPTDGTDALSEAFRRVNYRIKPIDDPRWTRDLRQNWAHWLSYALVEGLESAGLDGIGEFYPLKYHPVMPSDAVVFTPVSDLLSLLNAVRHEYIYRLEGNCVVFQARARLLARLQDAPEYLLTRWTQLPEPSLEWAADIACRLAPEQIQSLRTHRAAASHYLQTTQRNDKQAQRESFDRGLLASVFQYSDLYWLLRWYGQLPVQIRQRLQRGQAVALSELPPPARKALVALIELQLMRQPCTTDAMSYVPCLLECARITVQLAHYPNALVQDQEYELAMEGEPPQRVRYTERAHLWTFTIEGSGCPDGSARQVRSPYRSLVGRSLNPVKGGSK